MPTSPNPEPSLPDPSPELILLLAIVQARMRTLPKKERALFLADVSRSLGMQEASLNVLRFRPKSEDRAVFMAMKQARAWWSQAVAVAWRLDE